MKKKLQNLKFQIVPLLFSINCTYWTMSSLFRTPAFITPAAVILIHCFLFLWYEKEKDAGKKGNLEFMMGTALYILLILILIAVSNGLYGNSYVEWFKNTQPDSDILIGYWFVTLMLLCYFFASTVYYFSEIIFRLPVLFLLSVVPLLLQTLNTKKEINTPFILFLILLFSLYVEKTKRKEEVGDSYRKVQYSGYLQAVTLFVALTALLAVFFPKPSRLPRMEYVDAVLNYILRPVNDTAKSKLFGQNRDSNLLSPVKLRRTSSINAMQAPASDKVLFEIQADELLYFRVQTWDKYENNRWYIGNRDLENGYTLESQSRRQMKLDILLPLMERLKSNGALDFSALDIDEIFQAPSIPQERKSAYVMTKDYAMQSYLNTPGVINIKGEKIGPVYIDKLDSSFPGSRQNPGNSERYRIDYISQYLNPASREFAYVHRMNKSIYMAIESALLRKGGSTSETAGMNSIEQAVLRSARLEMAEANENFTKLPDNLPKRIYELAENLTVGKISDYDKALAIQQYFHSPDFKYDLYAEKTQEGRDCNDYFIFEGKRGGCVQFASAMVILARASGLPARYVEGFAAQEKDAVTGNYIIREKDAHAFPEIYISGFGWMVFEPTSSSEEPAKNLSKYLAVTFKSVGIIASRIFSFFKAVPLYLKLLFIPVLLGLAVIMAIIFAETRIRLWKKRVKKLERIKGLEEILSRIEKLLRKVNLSKEDYETPSNYADRIHTAAGISIATVTDIYYKAKYGGIEPSEQDVSAAVSKYEEIRLFVKVSHGRFKGWMI